MFYHKGMHMYVSPAVMKQIGLQVTVLHQFLCHPAMDSIVPRVLLQEAINCSCLRCNPLDMPEGFQHSSQQLLGAWQLSQG